MFTVREGNFLGHLITRRGVKADPIQIIVIDEMPRQKTVKDTRKLTGCLGALNRFISKYSDKFLPLFKMISSAGNWNPICEDAFSKIKAYFQDLPIL